MAAIMDDQLPVGPTKNRIVEKQAQEISFKVAVFNTAMTPCSIIDFLRIALWENTS